MAEWKTAGKVRMTPKGVYNASSTYEILDIVSNAEQSISYIAKGDVPAGTELTNTEYWAVIADVQEALDNVGAALSYIGETYDATKTYNAGTYCIHDGGMYVCIEDITTAEAWTATHWDSVTCGGEIEKINDRITNTMQTESVTGAVVCIDDAAKEDAQSLIVNILPVQDTHGYDNPWPGGSGKNLFDKAQLVSTGPVGVTQTGSGFVLNTLAAGTYKSIAGSAYGDFGGKTVYARAGIVNSGTNDGCLELRFMDSSGTEVGGTSTRLRLTPTAGSLSRVMPEGTSEIYVVCYSSRTESGSVGDTTAVTGFIVSLEDAPYEPYENVCPISGWTGVKVTRCGKNLLPNIKTQINNSLLVLGQTENYSAAQRTYLPAGTYYISVEYDAVATLYWRSTQDAEGGRISSGKTNPSGVFVVERPDYYAFWLYSSSGVPSNSVGNFQLKHGSTETAYVPYQGDTYDITFPTEAGTVYGGTLDVTNGTLTVDKVMRTFNTADMNNTKTYPGWKNIELASLIGSGIDATVNWTLNIGTVCGVNTVSTSNVLWLPTNTYGKTQTEWIALAMDVQVVIPLAAPVVYTLTKHDIEMLKGDNTIWADAGSVDISYLVDTYTKLYNMILELQALVLENIGG